MTKTVSENNPPKPGQVTPHSNLVLPHESHRPELNTKIT